MTHMWNMDGGVGTGVPRREGGVGHDGGGLPGSIVMAKGARWTSNIHIVVFGGGRGQTF
jgi:hypothetical protein